jgi:uncharacterized phiE125 gp8 family phage protein
MKYRSLTTLTEPVNEPVTLVEAKAYLRVDNTDEDTLIGTLITAARQWVESYLDRALILRQLVLRLDTFPVEIELPQPPLSTFGTTTAVSLTYTLETGTTATLSSSEYRIDRTSTPGVLRQNYSGSWPGHLHDYNSIAVTYWAGYGSDEGDMPPAIKNAILLMVGHLFENRSAVVTGTNTKPIEYALESLLKSKSWGSYQ